MFFSRHNPLFGTWADGKHKARRQRSLARPIPLSGYDLSQCSDDELDAVKGFCAIPYRKP